MYRVYDKGNNINFIGYDEGKNDKATELVMWQGSLYPLIMNRKEMKLVMDLSTRLREGIDFYFGKDD